MLMQMPSKLPSRRRTHPQARLGLTPSNSWISLPSLTLGVATSKLPQDKDRPTSEQTDTAVGPIRVTITTVIGRVILMIALS